MKHLILEESSIRVLGAHSVSFLDNTVASYLVRLNLARRTGYIYITRCFTRKNLYISHLRHENTSMTGDTPGHTVAQWTTHRYSHHSPTLILYSFSHDQAHDIPVKL